ncbi:SDR family NAD(P)-dependent oxidoreductase [Acetobacter sicerae]|uniref:SDR family NAD(P)-dependent oxidoreductase n=1 Tax=Acetobacter sicerae TaxID=85325 RepID=UPI0022AA0D2E|nr:SDR family NAD(P)-dependent oxidoreductase [Acetobacter sicerae]
MKQFEHKVALVTGAGSGMGRDIAIVLAERGAAVTLVGRREEKLAEVAAEITTAGGRVMSVAGDVSKPEDIERAVARTVEAFGGLHYAVNNAGVFVSLDTDGTLLVERGFVLPEDMPLEPEDLAGEDVATGGADDDEDREMPEGMTAQESEPEEEDGLKPLSDRLLTELTAWRTLALRDAFAGNPHIALTELLHTLVRDLYWQVSGADCLEAYVREISLPVHSPDMPGSLPAHVLRQRNEGWKHDLPEDEDAALWQWLDGLDDTSRMALLAHCLSFGVNALHASSHGPSLARSVRERLARADRLATALALDLAEVGWQPTVENYLGRVTKARILEAVREARGAEAAERIAHLKKGDMAQAAERLLEGSGWLPEALRTANAPERTEREEGAARMTDSHDAVAAE